VARKRHKAKAPRKLSESTAADTVTVAWMLSVVSAFLCEIAALAAWGLLAVDPARERLAVLWEILLFAALVIGLVSLLIVPVVLKVRRVPPPRAVMWFAVAVGVVPLVAYVIRATR